MNQEAHVRNFIRKKLAEEYDLGTDMGQETEFDLSTFDSTIDMLDKRKQAQEKRLNSMKKQLGISSHPDGEINRMMKRTQQIQIDDIEDDIDAIKDQEEELGKAKGEFEDMQKHSQGLERQMDQIQSQTGSSEDITNT